jgi:hypothetical protein
MSYPKLIELVKKLQQVTSTTGLNWKTTEAEGVFQASLADYTVRLDMRRSRMADGDEYFVSIFNWGGELVEELGDEDAEGMFPVMKELYELARRQALGVDKAIDSILKDLEFRQT